MTRREFSEISPRVAVDPKIRAAAGLPVTARVLITNSAPVPRTMSVTPVGVDAAWLPRPVRTRPVMPGQSVLVELELTPAAGTVAAAYPLSVAVQAIDPLRGLPTSSTTIAETALLVDAAGQIGVQITPAETEGYLRRRMSVVVHNDGLAPEQVRVEVQSSDGADVRLNRDVLLVPPGASVRVPGRIRIKPRIFGRRMRYGYTVTARGAAAPRRAEAGVTTKAFLGNNLSKALLIVSLCAMWAGAAVVFIPKISSAIVGGHDKSRQATTSAPDPAGAKPAGAGAGPATSIQLNGSVVGQAPGKVHVGIAPTSLVDEAAQAATPVGVDPALLGQDGKVLAQTVALVRPSSAAQARATLSQNDGAWAIGGVKAPGYYLLVFAKAGYQTQRYVVDSSSDAAKQPITVALVPGQGRLSGHVYGPGGKPVGAAQVAITDGINSITTSTNSRGDGGGWQVSGLSTPDAYVVTVSHDGLSTETALTKLAAGGSATVDITLKSGVGSLVGRVVGVNSLGASAGLGGARVTATNGTITRSASTVTASASNADIAGRYTLPDLPPGTYTLTAAADGYLPQTRQVTITPGSSGSTVPTIALQSSSAAVTGLVHTADGTPLNGVGIVLSSPTNTYKTATGSDGAFRLDGIAPGTYTLSASVAGFVPVVVNVLANAGQTTEVPVASLTMTPQILVADNSVAGFVASAVSPSGTLACPANAVSASTPCLITLAVTDDAGRPVLISTSKTGPFSSTLTLTPSGSGPTGYTIYGETSAGTAMGAGLYHVTVRAPGFLTDVLSVQVPFTGQAQAPQANLFPTNTLTGTINALGGGAGLNHDGPPDGKQNFTNCVYAFPSASAPATPPTTCNYTPPATSVCASSGQPETGYAVIDDNANYTIHGLCDGTYTVYVVITNPWYVNNVPPATETFTHGQTLTYSPTVTRLGRVIVSFAVNGQPPVTSLSGTLTCGGTTHTFSNVNPSTGQLTFEGVPAGTVMCSVQASDSSGIYWSGSSAPPGQPVTDNQDTAVTVPIWAGIFSAWGHVISPYDGNSANPVAQAQVKLTGDFLVNGVKQQRTVSQLTDGNGCWAFVDPTPPAPGLVAGAVGCTAIPLDYPLADPNVSITVNPVNPIYGLQLQSTTQAVTLSPAGNTITVRAVPIDTSPLLLQSSVPTDLTAATVTAVPLQAAGSGKVVVQIDPAATNSTQASLTWTDSIIGQPNQASPGTYTVTASAPGFTTVSATATCEPSSSPVTPSACVFDRALKLTPQPVAAQVRAALGTTTQFTNSAGAATSYPTQPLAGASVLAAPCSGSTAATCPTLNAAAPPAGTVRATVNSAGNVVATNGTTLKPGYYTMRVSSFGYATHTYGAPAGTTAPIKVGTGSTPVTATLTQTPVTFHVGINTPSGALLACPAAKPHCATVTLHRIDTAQADLTSSTQDGSHYYDFTNIDPATYLITVSGPGLQTTSTQYTVPLGGAAAPFRMAVSAVPAATPKTAAPSGGSSPATVSMTVTTSADGDDVAAATVQLTSAANPGTVLTPNPGISSARTDGRPGTVDSWTFTAVPAGDWQLSVTLPLTHYGTLAATGGPAITCQPGTASTPVRCTAAITVGRGNASVAVHLDEFLAGLRVASTPLTTDQNPSPPATVALAVTDGARTVFSSDAFAVDGGTPTATFWGAAGTTYSATVSGVPPGWQAGTQTYTVSNPHQDLALTEVAPGPGSGSASGAGSGAGHSPGSGTAPGAPSSGVPPVVPPAVPADPSPGAS